jgi:hypothetical protein
MNTPEYQSLLLNPYESPTDLAEPYSPPQDKDMLRFGLGFALRAAFYAFCGALLFAAFCTPLNVAQEMFWTRGGPNWVALGCIVASSLFTGLMFDGPVRAGWHPLLVGFFWAMANAVVFAFLILLLSGPKSSASFEGVVASAIFAGFVGPLYGVFCLHLSLPISALCAWGAKEIG